MFVCYTSMLSASEGLNKVALLNTKFVVHDGLGNETVKLNKC